MSPGYRWTLDEYVLRCENLPGLREVVVEGELDRDLIADVLARCGANGVTTLDADYLAISEEEVNAAGFSLGVKGELLTLAAALNGSDLAEQVISRVAVVVDRDYDDLDAQGCLLVTDGYSIENYALSADGLDRFAAQVLGRRHLPEGRSGEVPVRRTPCSGEELYERIVHVLATVAGLRMALRELDPPVGLVGSWLDYFKISSDGLVDNGARSLLHNVLSNSTHCEATVEVQRTASEASARAIADPARLVRGRDFVELLAKLLRSTWGRGRGGYEAGRNISRLARLLVFSLDPAIIDSSELMEGLRHRFAGQTT